MATCDVLQGQSASELLQQTMRRRAPCRDKLAKDRWRFKQNHLPEKVCPLLVAVIHELETVQGASRAPTPWTRPTDAGTSRVLISPCSRAGRMGGMKGRLRCRHGFCVARTMCISPSPTQRSSRHCTQEPHLGRALHPATASHVAMLLRAGISKFACVGYGWGADPLWPLAQSGAVDAWAIVHGHINRGFIRQVKVPGIVQVRSPMAADSPYTSLPAVLCRRNWSMASSAEAHVPGVMSIAGLHPQTCHRNHDVASLLGVVAWADTGMMSAAERRSRSVHA